MAHVGKGVQLCLSWIHDRNGCVPSNAINTGEETYICRAHYGGDVIPGKIIPKFNKAYISYGGKEHEIDHYEVLCDTKLPHSSHTYRWERARNGHIPRHAIVGGMSSSGDPIYIAREFIDGERVIGKVHSGHDCAYFPHGGLEKSLHDYEVLVMSD